MESGPYVQSRCTDESQSNQRCPGDHVARAWRELTSTAQDGWGARRFCRFLPTAPQPQPTHGFCSPAPCRSEVARYRPVNTGPTQMLTAGPGAHMLSHVFTTPHRHSWCTQSTNLKTCLPACTCTRGHTPACTHTTQNNPRQGLPSTCLAANQTNQLGLA